MGCHETTSELVEGVDYTLTETCARCGGGLGRVDVYDNGEVCEKCEREIREEGE